MASLWGAVTGSISGTLVDLTGGVIPGVTITVTNAAQGVETRTVTDANGFYVFPSLPVGVYNLKTDAKGFKPQDKSAVAVDLDSKVEINLTLELAERAEEVTVTETEVHVET